MPTKRTPSRRTLTKGRSTPSADARRPATARPARAANPPADVAHVVERLKSLADPHYRDNLGPRFGIHTTTAFGVSVPKLRKLAREFGPSHDLAEALWKTGLHDARMLAPMVDEPDRVTPAQMNRWCRDFDNWAVCDSACFCLFDRTPHVFDRVAAWAGDSREFVRRAAFALLASAALHQKTTPDAEFRRCLALIEAAAGDDRNFVKKGVSWALRGIGGRSSSLYPHAMALAERLAKSDLPAARWIGRDALKDLSTSATRKRLARGDRRKSTI